MRRRAEGRERGSRGWERGRCDRRDGGGLHCYIISLCGSICSGYLQRVFCVKILSFVFLLLPSLVLSLMLRC